MRFKALLYALFLLLLSGCASKPPTADLLANMNSIATADTPISAKNAVSLEAKLNTTTTIELDSNSRVLSFGGYKSFYKAVEVKSDDSGSLKFQIESICACLGYDKRVAVPVVLAMDALGGELPITDLKYTKRSASGLTPFRLVMQGSVISKKDSVVRLLLLADNSGIDYPIRKIEIVSQYGIHLMDIEILAYPMGKYVLTLGASAD
jgi:hypothetical protein